MDTAGKLYFDTISQTTTYSNLPLIILPLGNFTLYDYQQKSNQSTKKALKISKKYSYKPITQILVKLYWLAVQVF